MGEPRAHRPAPLVGVVDPAVDPTVEDAPFGSHAAVARAGQSLLAAELTGRIGAHGGAVARVMPSGGDHWGRWYVAAMRDALAHAGEVDAIGYAGAGALALLPDMGLDALLSPIPGEAVANNRFSADAFVVAGDVHAALDALESAASDNAAARHLEEAGFACRDLRSEPWSRFDVDTSLDLALLRLATRLPGTRPLAPQIAGFLEMATLPGGGRLEVPRLAELGAVIRDRTAELVVAGRVPAAGLAYLETETACRVRAFVEERGMRSDRAATPRSLLGAWTRRLGPKDLVTQLASLGDAVILDTRVVMAALAGSSDAAAWPPEEERFASDFGDHARVATPWLAELTEAASSASLPVLLGGHALVSDGLRILVEAAWLGR